MFDLLKYSRPLILCALCTSHLAHPVSNYIHTVKPGEILSEILIKRFESRIYGQDGILVKTLELNPEIKKSRGNKIYPGQSIILPEEHKEKKLVQEESRPVLTRLPSDDISDDAKASLSFYSGVDFFKINGKDKSTGDESVILSEASPYAGLSYNLHWSDVTTISLGGSFQNYKLQKLNDGQSFDDNNGHRVRVSLGLTRSFSERWDLGTGVSFDQDLFFHSASLTKLNVDKVLITKPYVTARYFAMKKNKASIGLDGKLGVNLPGETNEYKIRGGNHAGAGAFFRYQSKDTNPHQKALEARVSYSVDSQDTSIANQKNSNLSFAILYQWDLPW